MVKNKAFTHPQQSSNDDWSAMAEPILYRRASKRDSRFIARMIEISSDGIAAIEWQQQAELDGECSAMDIGSELYAQDDGDYSYRNCLIAESDRPVGMVLAFPITNRNFSHNAKPPPFEADDIFAPYAYLEALNSWYICGLAVLPEFRKQGIASNLLKMSIQRGHDKGYHNVSLVAMMQKRKLIEFYETRGFEITRSAPIVDHPQIRARGLAVLMETLPFR